MKPSAEDALHGYVRAFESLDPDAVASYYHCPSMFVTSVGDLQVTSRKAAVDIASQLIGQARAEGYHRTEIHNLETRKLADNLELLSGVFIRFDTGDAEINRFGFTYIMRYECSGWQMVVAVAYQAPDLKP